MSYQYTNGESIDTGCFKKTWRASASFLNRKQFTQVYKVHELLCKAIISGASLATWEPSAAPRVARMKDLNVFSSVDFSKNVVIDWSSIWRVWQMGRHSKCRLPLVTVLGREVWSRVLSCWKMIFYWEDRVIWVLFPVKDGSRRYLCTLH